MKFLGYLQKCPMGRGGVNRTLLKISSLLNFTPIDLLTVVFVTQAVHSVF